MKDNTYDIPGMKFYFVFPSGKFAIPFENVDGLRVSEVKEACQVSSFGLLSAIEYKDLNGIEQLTRINQINFSSNYLLGKENTRIDKLFEDNLKQCIGVKKMERTYACFLERYQGKEYQEIKQLLKNNKK